ncbi:hypothetical protein A3K86_20450 [Photobacterium jeanii]|uniref:Uncharacterized protein n=1 Tax=Photobacterium jeanii TaxID=858640 RepID=A0A178K300_9GAMM|nr:hypothetical protein [Photobacterium jeanii]OAN11325.1 hypothetical protein A3K86_20450 [Photobacterium jeanii]PST90846.1 hypothetical protein C9I91_09555 [Photobacterium jeanii]
MFELDDDQIKFVSGAFVGEEGANSGNGSGEENKPKPPCYCNQPTEPCPIHRPPQNGEEGYYR